MNITYHHVSFFLPFHQMHFLDDKFRIQYNANVYCEYPAITFYRTYRIPVHITPRSFNNSLLLSIPPVCQCDNYKTFEYGIWMNLPDT